jgi:hypothetical protein
MGNQVHAEEKIKVIRHALHISLDMFVLQSFISLYRLFHIFVLLLYVLEASASGEEALGSLVQSQVNSAV